MNKKRILPCVCLALCLLLLCGAARADAQRDWDLSCRFKVLFTTETYEINFSQNGALVLTGTVAGGTYCKLAKDSVFTQPSTGVSYRNIVWRQDGVEKTAWIKAEAFGSCMKYRMSSSGNPDEVHELLYDENAVGRWTYYTKADQTPLYLTLSLSGMPVSTHAQGTKVEVMSTDFSKAYVRINGQTGYMRMSDLTSQKPAQVAGGAADERTVMYVATANGGSLFLRRHASVDSIQEGCYANGTQVTVLSRYNGWARVITPDGKEGYMMLSHLSAGNAETAQQGTSDSETAGGVTRFIVSKDGKPVPLYATTSNWEGEQKGQLSSGTRVTAYPVEGEWSTWCYVSTGETSGYVLSSALGAQSVAAAEQGTLMQIATGNDGKLNLRKGKSAGSDSLGRYANGTVVEVISTGGGWSYVRIGKRTGYMMAKYLKPLAEAETGSASEPAVTAPAQNAQQSTAETAQPAAFAKVMYVQTGNPQRLHLRQRMSTGSKSLGLYDNGTAVQVLGVSGGWAQVQIGNKTGYMMKKFLTDIAPNAAEPAPQAANAPVQSESQPVQGQAAASAASAAPAEQSGGTIMYVQTGNTGRLHLRSQARVTAKSLGLFENGTQVTVYAVKNGWARVSVQGQSGYMQLKFLSTTAP